MDFGGDLPPTFVSKRNFISDPISDTGLKDPRYPGGKQLSETGWVKFVWIDACYSNVAPGYQDMNDMASAFGMDSDNNRYWFGDQSYIGFDSVTPGGYWFDGWISAMYNWLFWNYLSLWNEVDPEPYYGVYQAWWLTQIQITEWEAAGYHWASALKWCSLHNTYSEPSSLAKLKCHRQ